MGHGIIALIRKGNYSDFKAKLKDLKISNDLEDGLLNKSCGGYTPLVWAIYYADHYKNNADYRESYNNILIKLLKTLKNENIPAFIMTDNAKRTAMHWAVKYNNLELVQWLLEYGGIAQCGLGDLWNWTPAHYAVYQDKTEIAEYLIKKTYVHYETKSDYVSIKKLVDDRNTSLFSWINFRATNEQREKVVNCIKQLEYEKENRTNSIILDAPHM